MKSPALSFSEKSRRTPESPIAYFMEQALGNPQLISLAAGMVDAASLPSEAISQAVTDLLSDPTTAKAALQYGTTNGYAPLREKVLNHVAALDGTTPTAIGMTPREVVLTTGSQQMLYMLSELLIDAGDIVITEAPSYFVFHAVLAGTGARVLTVPMDEDGMDTRALTELLRRIELDGDLKRVKFIYTVDYFQNPTGLTLSAERRREMLEIVRSYADRQRILILEDAAYRELRYEGDEIPSIKSFDTKNQHVVYAGTFSKPCSPGLKTGYALMPVDLVEPLIRLKGNHDFGSANFSQYILNRLLENGDYARQVLHLRDVYRVKRDAMLSALSQHFSDWESVTWTHPRGGMFVWLTMPESISTSPDSPFVKAAVKEGVLFVPGEFGHIPINGERPHNEARLSFGDATPEKIHEGIRRLRKAAEAALQQVNRETEMLIA